MASHADILERSEPLALPFWASLAMHVVLIGGIAVSAIVEHSHHLNMGSPTGGRFGSVTVSPVNSIPIPNRGGAENPVANDTQSQVPTPPVPKKPEKAKPAPKVPENAIPLKVDRAPKKQAPEPAQQPNKFRDQQKYSDSQLYSTSGQRMSSSTFQIQGGGAVGLGDSSPFGEQYGAYANSIRDIIGRNWRPVDQHMGAPSVVITFTILRNGSVDKPKVSTSSGNMTLDNSALRAVMDAQLPPLPTGFPRPQADVQMRFEVGK
jgi:protein TonB